MHCQEIKLLYAHNECSDAKRTYGRYLNTLSRLHRKHRSKAKDSSSFARTTSRLPAGGSQSSCCCNKWEKDQVAQKKQRILKICTLPDDEFVRELDLQTLPPKTILSETKATQTKDGMDQDDNLENAELNDEKDQDAERIEDIDNELRYYHSNKGLKDKNKAISARKMMLHKLNFWRRSGKHISSPDERDMAIQPSARKRDSQDKEYRRAKLCAALADKGTECPNCANMPEISHKLSQLTLKYTEQGRIVQQVQKDVDGIKRSMSDSRQSEAGNSTQKNCIGIAALSDASTSTNKTQKDRTPNQRMALSTQLEVQKSNNSSDICLCSPVEVSPTKKVDENNALCRKVSSTCPFCANRPQPVLDGLICETLKLIGDRQFNEIMLTMFLREDNIYHVTVQDLLSKKALGCLLASDAAVQEANRMDFFKAILTFHIFDVRHTIPIRNINGISFEFNPRRKDDSCLNSKSMDSRISDFCYKVLELPKDEVRVNPCPNAAMKNRLNGN